MIIVVVFKVKKAKGSNIFIVLYLTYHIVLSTTSPSRFEAHAGLFILVMKGILDAYVLRPFDKKKY